MIFETTYTKRETILEINKLVGKPYSLLERLKMKGIGSKRMAISAISEEYQEYMNADHYMTHANIELRPKGIILHFRYKLESYAWPMPYGQVVVETTPILTFKSSGKFISFKNGMEVNKLFIDKIISTNMKVNQA